MRLIISDAGFSRAFIRARNYSSRRSPGVFARIRGIRCNHRFDGDPRIINENPGIRQAGCELGDAFFPSIKRRRLQKDPRT